MEVKTNNEKAYAFHVSIFYHVIASILMPAVFMALPLLNKNVAYLYAEEQNLVYLLTASVASGILINIGIYRHNYSKKIITSVLFNDEDKIIQFNYQKMYSTKKFSDQLPYSMLVVDSANDEVLPIALRDNKIVFKNGEKYFGEISLGGTYWNQEGGKVNLIRRKLSEIVKLNNN